MGITEVRSPWNRSRTGFSDQNRFGHSPQSSRNDKADCYRPETRRDMPVEQPHDGNRIVEPVARDKR
jgi:hypothetical protein